MQVTTFGWEMPGATGTPLSIRTWQSKTRNTGDSGLFSPRTVLLEPKNRNKNFNSTNLFFSWHEIGKYDVPAMIDHIIKTTGNKQISYLGHSQGSTTFFVMLSERPEYNDKIKVMFSLAPVAYCSHMVSPLFQALGRLSPIINVRIF